MTFPGTPSCGSNCCAKDKYPWELQLGGSQDRAQCWLLTPPGYTGSARTVRSPVLSSTEAEFLLHQLTHCYPGTPLC